MKKYIKFASFAFLGILSLAILFISLSPSKGEAAPDATLYINPASTSTTPGSTIVLNAMLNPGTNQVIAVGLVVRYNPTQLRLVSLNNTSSPFSNVLSAAATSSINGTTEQLSYDAGVPLTPGTPVSTTSLIGAVSFQVLTQGSSVDSTLTIPSTAEAYESAGVNVVTTRTGSTVSIFVADVTAPVISSISANTPTHNAATITWTTDESASGQVEYGLSSAYTASSTIGATSTLHSIGLSSLTPSTTYHYRVISIDSSGNRRNSLDQTFSTTAAPDTTVPTVTLTSPTAASYAGNVTLAASASDNVAVAGVRFYVDTTLIVDDTTSTYGTVWNSSAVSDGSHAILAVAYDAAGNSSATSSVSITVDNTGPVTSVGPSAGSLTTTGATITWTTNESSSGQIEYGLSTTYTASSTLGATTTTHSIAISSLSPSTLYHYRTISIDALGNRTNGTDGTFTTLAVPDTTVPSTSITSPTASQQVSGTITLTASAADNIGVAGVRFYIDSTILVGSEDISSPYTASLDTTSLSVGSHNVRSVARDTSDNLATSSAVTFIVDNVAPTIVLSSTASSPASSTPFTLTLTTSEPTSNFVVGDISVTNATLSSFASASSTSYSVSVTPTVTGTVTIAVSAGVFTDTAGNSNTVATPFTITSDITVPTATLTSASSSPISAATVINIAISESTSDFAIGDLTPTNGTLSAFSGSGTTYAVTITPTTSGTVTLALPAGGFHDSAGNSNTVATPFTITADLVAPVISTKTINGASIVLTYDKALRTTPLPATTDFSVVINGAGGVNPTTRSISGSAVTLTLASGVQAEDIVTLSYTPGSNPIKSAAGVNAASLTGSAVTNITTDTTAPTVSITTPASSGGLVSGSVSIIATSTDNIGVVGVKFYVDSTSGSLIQAEDTSSPFTATLDTTTLSDGIHTLYAVSRDLAGNTTTSSGRTIDVDNTGPSISFSATVSSPISTAFTLTMTASEAITGFAVGDIQITGGTLSSFVASTSRIYTVVVTPTVNGTITVTVPAGSYIDALSTSNNAASSYSIVYDPVAPLLSSATVDEALLTIIFNKALLDSSVPSVSDFAVSVNAIAVNTSGLSISGSNIVITLANKVNKSDVVSVVYTLGSTPIKSSAGVSFGSSSATVTATNETSSPQKSSSSRRVSGGGGSASASPIVIVSPKVPVPGCLSGYTFSSTNGSRCSTSFSGFSKSLTIGSIGEEVRALQSYLNTHGFPISLSGIGSNGQETTYFGALTKSMLAKFQAAKGIFPAVGFFGPLTKAYIQSHQ